MTVSFNLERALLSDVRTRRAIAHALDREQFVERVIFGQRRVAEAPIHSGISSAHATGLEMPSYDIAEAQRLLEEAGWRQEGEGTRVAEGVEGVKENASGIQLRALPELRPVR